MTYKLYKKSFDEHSTDSLVKGRIRLIAEIAQIRNKLDIEKHKVALGEEAKDSDWFSNHTRYLRRRGIELQALEAEIGKRKKAENVIKLEENRERNKTFDRIFVEVARGTLEPEIFKQIATESREIVDAEIEIDKIGNC